MHLYNSLAAYYDFVIVGKDSNACFKIFSNRQYIPDIIFN